MVESSFREIKPPADAPRTPKNRENSAFPRPFPRRKIPSKNAFPSGDGNAFSSGAKRKFSAYFALFFAAGAPAGFFPASHEYV